MDLEGAQRQHILEFERKILGQEGARLAAAQRRDKKKRQIGRDKTMLFEIDWNVQQWR